MKIREPVLVVFLATVSLQFVFSQAPLGRDQTIYVEPNLWESIEGGLNQPTSTPSYDYILSLVEEHCASDQKCLYPTYNSVVDKLETVFDLPAAISVLNEMVRLAQREGNHKHEAESYTNLSRFYGALGYPQSSLVYLDKAITICEKSQNTDEVIWLKFMKHLLEITPNNREEILKGIELLLKEAGRRKLTRTVQKIHLQLVMEAIGAKDYKRAEPHLKFLENIQILDLEKSNNSTSVDYSFPIIASKSRADLAVVKGKLDEAEQYYQKTLYYCDLGNSLWLKIHTDLTPYFLETDSTNWYKLTFFE